MNAQANRNKDYSLSADGTFVIKDYNNKPPFVNFFPAIAGKYGVPLWVFYVNRGQCLSSFGVKDKDNAILEFQPADKAYMLTPVTGFRTFVLVDGYDRFEPFKAGAGQGVEQELRISPASFTLHESREKPGMKIETTVSTVSNRPYPALIRRLSIINTSQKKIFVKIADGLPRISPYGTFEFLHKNMSTTAQAWMETVWADRTPLFKMKVEVADVSAVKRIKGGHFYSSYAVEKGAKKDLSKIIDPAVMFGEDKSFHYPMSFMRVDFSDKFHQIQEGRFPCCFSLHSADIGSGEQVDIYTIAGRIEDVSCIDFIHAETGTGYYEKCVKETAAGISGLTQDVHTNSGMPVFDHYIAQAYLDNVLRGGLPVRLGGEKGPVFHLYSRKHGDPERDYNAFKLAPEYLSSGEGNYRDVNQNRRNDVFFGVVRHENLKLFASLIQTDGYNPLVVGGSTFKLKDRKGLLTYIKKSWGAEAWKLADRDEEMAETPQSVLLSLEKAGIHVEDKDSRLAELSLYYAINISARHGEGFWTDHWAYLTDLIESFDGVYPEELENILFEKRDLPYFDNTYVVLNRENRYIKAAEGFTRQYKSIAEDNEKVSLIASRTSDQQWMRAKNGTGQCYTGNLFEKLFCIVCNKAATLDPFGRGIEMEAGKPNWYDALNGLPAIFGSSTCETFELLRLTRFLQRHTAEYDGTFTVFAELAAFMRRLTAVFQAQVSDKEKDLFLCWRDSNTAKEEYREKTRLGISGVVETLKREELEVFLKVLEKKLESGIERSFSKEGLPYSYFYHEMTGDISFTPTPLPLFLEGVVHCMRLEKDSNVCRSLHSRVKKSGLYDTKLKMFKVNACLDDAPDEIGRARTFTRGWLENESIWLHMEYKYLLELLRRGLCDEFFAAFKNCFIPFLDPAVYGRSTLENSSFIVSSAHPDAGLHGRGCVARLTGSTAEIVHIWRHMCVGEKPFRLGKNGKLELRFEPVLPDWLFTDNGEFSFKFLGRTMVTYTRKGMSRYPIKLGAITVEYRDGTMSAHKGCIEASYAQAIRSGKAVSVRAELL